MSITTREHDRDGFDSEFVNKDTMGHSAEALETVPNESASAQTPAEPEYPTKWKYFSIFFGLFLAFMLYGLDRSIVSTAAPKITTEFNSLKDLAWYGSAFTLSGSCVQLMLGKLYAEFSIKWMFLSTLGLFLAGSILCAVAPNSASLIAGRAVQGLGASGISIGCIMIIAVTTPLHDRPKYTGILGGAAGVAQSIAPTLGGYLTDRLSWRWCFWINLPLGALTFVVVFLFFQVPASPAIERKPTNLKELASRLDLLGSAFLLPSLVCLLLALQWGSEEGWHSWKIILLFCIFGITIIIWGTIQVRKGDRATLPPRILKQRSMAAILVFICFIFAMLFIVIYFVSIWFQAVQGFSASKAGVSYMAVTVSMAVMVIVAGQLTTLMGYYTPLIIASSLISTLSCAFLFTWDIDTSTVWWATTLVLQGVGLGIGSQLSVMVPQTRFPPADLAPAISAMTFVQNISGTVFLPIAETIFSMGLVSQLKAIAPSVDPEVVISNGATNLRVNMVLKYSSDEAEAILVAYAKAMKGVWIMCLVLACLSLLGAGCLEWVSVKKRPSDNEKMPVTEAASSQDSSKDGSVEAQQRKESAGGDK